MRFLKSNPIFSLLNSYLIDSPQPANISYMWNFGSLLGICLLIQILTGVFLAMHYTPNVDLAFISVEHIMRDVNSGWFLRYTHANVASFFFLFLYFHTARGLYYSSYKTPRVLLWSIGVIILILTMAIAFLGYEHSPKWFNVALALDPNCSACGPQPQPFGLGQGRAETALLTLKEGLQLFPWLWAADRTCKWDIILNIKELVVNYWYFLSFYSCFLITTTKNTIPILLLFQKESRAKKVNLLKYSIYSAKSKGSYIIDYLTCRGCGSLSFSGKGIKLPLAEQSSQLLLEKINNVKPTKTLDMSDRLNAIIKELNINPEYIFENLNLEETKQDVLKKTKGLSGIYMIINKVSQDYYIGSASNNRFYARFTNHLFYFRGSKIVKLAVKKYKIENFAFIILEIFPKTVTKENNKELLDLEDKYLKLLLPNYNILTEAGSSFGYKHTEVDRQKMKDIYSIARRERIGQLNKGKILSSETLEKIRIKALNRVPMSEETKKKCITNTSCSRVAVVLYNLNGTVYGKYLTIKEAANAIYCNEKTIIRSLKTEKKLVKGQWIVKDLTDS